MLSNLKFEFNRNDMAFPRIFTHKLAGVLENIQSLFLLHTGATASAYSGIGIDSSGVKKYEFWQVNGNVGFSIPQSSSSDADSVREIVYILKNNASSSVTITASGVTGFENNIINLYDADLLSTGVSIPAGKTLKLTFTFLDGANVVIEGKMSV